MIASINDTCKIPKRKPYKIYEKLCMYCGTTFRNKKWHSPRMWLNRKFCSLTCAHQDRRRPTNKCLTCLNVYRSKWVSHKESKYCSPSCAYNSKDRTAKNRTHGDSMSRFYRLYNAIERRCNDPRQRAYSRYGAKGVRNLWSSYENFKKDMYQGYLEHMNAYPFKGTSIDRIDPYGDYCKENCRWATRQEQAENKRRPLIRITYKNQSLSLKEFSELIGLNLIVVRSRYNNKWSPEKIASTPYPIP